MSHNVKIRDIENEDNKILKRDFEFEIEELSASVESSLVFKSLGEFIDVKGNVKGIVNVECDVCLTPYEHKLDFSINEMYAKTSLYGEYGNDVELKGGQFVVDLDGADEIDVYDLLYQSVILSLPNKKVCGINCNEELFMKDDSFEVHDSRMDVFKTIKIDK